MQNLSTSRVSYTIYIMWCSERHENCTYDKTTTTLKPVLSIQPAVDLKPLIPKTLTYTCMVTSGAFAWLDGSTLEPTFGTTARGAGRSAAPPPRFPGPRTGGGESEGDVVACKGPGMGVSTEPLDSPWECTEWPGVHDCAEVFAPVNGRTSSLLDLKMTMDSGSSLRSTPTRPVSKS